MLPNIFADGIIIVCVIIGVLLVIWPLLKGARSIWTEQQTYKYTGDFFEEWNEITPQIQIRKFEELTV
jgi:hypothetical protein